MKAVCGRFEWFHLSHTQDFTHAIDSPSGRQIVIGLQRFGDSYVNNKYEEFACASQGWKWFDFDFFGRWFEPYSTVHNILIPALNRLKTFYNNSWIKY